MMALHPRAHRALRPEPLGTMGYDELCHLKQLVTGQHMMKCLHYVN